MPLLPPVGDRDHAQGPAEAPLTLVEYGDFQCPYCAEAAEIVDRVRARYGDQLRFVFREFPLLQIHPYALGAARAAEAAADAGRFWPMHDALFANQDRLDPRDLVALGEQLGVDPEAMVRALEGALDERIEDDLQSGEASEVRGTPTFFLNGQKLDGWREDDLVAAIKAL